MMGDRWQVTGKNMVFIFSPVTYHLSLLGVHPIAARPGFDFERHVEFDG